MVRADDAVEHAAKIFQAGGGNDNGVAAPIGIFRDAQKAATRVLAEIEDKILALDRDVFTFQNDVHP